MQKHLTFFIALFIGFSSLAQVNLDSLWNVWNDKSQPDSSRLEVIGQIIWHKYMFSQPDSALFYSQNMFILAESNNNKERMSYALNAQASYYNIIGEIDMALLYYQKSLELNEELNFKKGISGNLGNIALIYKDKGNYDKAIIYFKKSLLISKEIGDKLDIANSYSNIGVVFYEKGDYKNALINYKKSIKISEAISALFLQTNLLNNIGALYTEKQDYQQALVYFKKGIQVSEDSGNKSGLSNSYRNIGSIYLFQSNFEKALDYYERSLKISKELNEVHDIAYTLSNIGVIYAKLNNTEKALDFHIRSLKIRKDIDDKIGIAESYYQMGTIYANLEKHKKAFVLLLKSKDLYTKMNVFIGLEKVTKVLSYQYKILDNNKKAFEMLELYMEYKDTLAAMNSKDELIRFELEKEFDLEKQADSIYHKDQMLIQKAMTLAKEEQLKNEKTIRYSLFGGLGLVILFSLFISNRFRITNRQKKVIELQKEQVEEKNQEIMDSIQYAKRLQKAILPSKKIIKDYIPESFILYIPKDIVAGDFYWLEKTKNTTLFAVADCTGHGVPGAMVSVICNNGLNRSVREHNITQPSKILDKTREIVIQEFAKSSEEIQDGMDIALCSIKGDKLNYAGANNPLIVIRDKQVIKVKADRQPIGARIKAVDFTNHILDIQKDDMIYIFTDGFADQFGGEKGKKYRLKNLLALLTNISTKELSEQNSILKQEFTSWKGSEDQIDDVCVMGVRV